MPETWVDSEDGAVWLEDGSLDPSTAVTDVRDPCLALELIARPTLVPVTCDRLERPPSVTRVPRFAAFATGVSVGAGAASGAVCGLAAVVLAVAVAVSLRSLSLEAALAEGVSSLRQALPWTTVPIERLEVALQDVAYRAARWVVGAPSEPLFLLPADRIEFPPDIPEGGPHFVPEVSFDPSILEVPFTFEPLDDGPEWIAVSRPVLNPAFPNDRALVLKFDADRASVRWQPGRTDPWPTANRERLAEADPAPDRSGKVPVRDRAFVVFGGGFQSLHFPGFGARWSGRDVIPPKRDLQTLAVYADGHAELGPWGTLPTDGVVELRQNLPPLVHAGKIPAGIAYLNAGTLGADTEQVDGVRTYTSVHTWRSALGMRADGDFVYVLAARVTPQLLAATMIRAGAVEAMQLDINALWHAAPTLAVPGDDGLVTRPLFAGVDDFGRRFVDGADRDFVYVVER